MASWRVRKGRIAAMALIPVLIVGLLAFTIHPSIAAISEGDVESFDGFEDMTHPTPIGVNVYDVINDFRGAPVAAYSRDQGEVVWQAKYDAFGRAEALVDPDQNGVPFVLNVRTPGQYHDAETGLHYNWHRYYMPEIGRYLQPDPKASLNPYVYAEGNPNKWFDQDGNDIEDILLALRTYSNFGTANSVVGGGMKLIYGAKIKAEEIKQQSHRCGICEPVPYTIDPRAITDRLQDEKNICRDPWRRVKDLWSLESEGSKMMMEGSIQLFGIPFNSPTSLGDCPIPAFGPLFPFDSLYRLYDDWNTIY